MKKLWQKNWQLDKTIETFETKDDLVMDQKLVKFDVWGSIAHAQMLAKIGILSHKEFKTAKRGLLEILKLDDQNNFILQAGDEDIHTKIENYLTTKYGEVGKKIHTGRSRNDQVLTALRLYTKEKLLFVWQDLLILIGSFYQFAKKHEFVAMPGFTHMQKAMPSSVGMWAGALTEALLDDLVSLKAGYYLVDKSPLGSAAGYGVPLNLDRQYTSDLLGFKSVLINSLYVQNSRGKVEATLIAQLNTILFDFNKFASDVLYFTSSEIEYFTVAAELCSGSSIMPQKKNVDIAELLRSKLHLGLGNYLQIASLSSNLISGYNRDLQDSKKPFIEYLEMLDESIKVATILINNLWPNEEKLAASLTPEIFAAHQAFELVSQGISFREAYQRIGKNLSGLSTKNKKDFLMQSTHLGGTGNLGLEKYKVSITQEKKIHKSNINHFILAIRNLEGKGYTEKTK